MMRKLFLASYYLSLPLFLIFECCIQLLGQETVMFDYSNWWVGVVPMLLKAVFCAYLTVLTIHYRQYAKQKAVYVYSVLAALVWAMGFLSLYMNIPVASFVFCRVLSYQSYDVMIIALAYYLTLSIYSLLQRPKEKMCFDGGTGLTVHGQATCTITGGGSSWRFHLQRDGAAKKKRLFL
ncbi:MAG: hypothetical protein ACOX88_09450 [Christensenellales bacterium]|jgi:hypothetical protein